MRVLSLFLYPDAVAGILNRPIPSKIALNSSRGTATSAIWKTIFPPDRYKTSWRRPIPFERGSKSNEWWTVMIAHVHRPRRKAGGKVVAGRIWRARLKLNGAVKARDISLGVSNKQVAEQKLPDAIREHERKAVWRKSPRRRQRGAFKSPLEAVISEYLADLVALGRSEDHVRHVDKRLRRLMRECGWQSPREATRSTRLTSSARSIRAARSQSAAGHSDAEAEAEAEKAL